MTRLGVPSQPRTALGQVRETLGRVEDGLGRLPGSGAAAVELVILLDEAAGRLDELEAAGANVGAERERLESAWRRMQRQARDLLREAGPALRAERERRGAEAERPWWFLDQSYAQTQRRAVGKALLVGLAVLLTVAFGWFVYERWIGPPPEVRQALRYIATGQELASGGELEAALESFEAAVALTPDDPEPLLWAGVLRQELGDAEGARENYDAARELVPGERSFLFQRGTILLQVGDTEAALVDAEAAIRLSPRWGYGFYLRASAEAEQGRIETAITDYQVAADLAHVAEDVELEAMARAQLALLEQYPQDR